MSLVVVYMRTLKNKKIYYIPIILVLLLLVYSYNDVMTSRQAGFSDGNRGPIYVLLGAIISLLTIYNTIRKNKAIIRSNLSISLWLLTFWVILINLINGSDFWIYLAHISLCAWWIMSYYFFYNYLSHNPQSKHFLIKTVLVMFLFYIWANFFIRQNIIKTYDRDFAVTGYAYYIILFVPYMGLIKKNWVRILLWIFALIFTFTSYKRGPMVILPIMFFSYYFSLAKNEGNWRKFISKIIIFSLLIIGVFISIDSMTKGFLSDRFSEEELSSGSGRTDLWQIALNNIESRSTIELFLGTGSGSSIKLLGTGAHNEWIEFLFSFGIVGIILYLGMCISLYKSYKNAVRIKSIYSPHLSMMISYVIIVGLFGGFFFVHSSFYAFSFFGLVESLCINNKNTINRINYENRDAVQ